MNNWTPFAVMFGCLCIWPAMCSAVTWMIAKNGLPGGYRLVRESKNQKRVDRVTLQN